VTKRKKNKDEKSWFSFLKRDGKKKPAAASVPPRKRKKKRRTAACAVVASGAVDCRSGAARGGPDGRVYGDGRYVKTLPQIESAAGPLILKKPTPPWLESSWTEHIVKTVGGRRFVLDEAAARTVAERLAAIPWMYDVRVQATSKALEISAQYRRPIVSVRLGGRTYYVDEKMIVFEALPVTMHRGTRSKGLFATDGADAGNGLAGRRHQGRNGTGQRPVADGSANDGRRRAYLQTPAGRD
jgi:hypothetical protein